MLHVTPTGSDPVTVTVTSTAPFAKTLSAKYTPQGGGSQPTYTVTRDSDQSTTTVTIYSNDYSGNVSVAWPSGFPDNTNSLMSSWSTTPQTLAVAPNGTYTFLFLGTGDSTEGFTVTPGTLVTP